MANSDWSVSDGESQSERGKSDKYQTEEAWSVSARSVCMRRQASGLHSNTSVFDPDSGSAAHGASFDDIHQC